MYCIKCGVKLAEGKKPCPLCGTVPFHPEVTAEEADRLYPAGRYPANNQVRPTVILTVITTLLFLLPIIITLQCDILITGGGISWSGYVVGALLTAYSIVVLPLWFKKPNPVIFVPIAFTMVGLYLLYINFAVDGNWFLSFAFPLVGFVGLNVTAVVTLVKYVRRGLLYIFGGSVMATGLFMPVMEQLLHLTFDHKAFHYWSVYPMTALVILGGLLIFLAICRPARETMERKFFI